jgi:hypothetical protein
MLRTRFDPAQLLRCFDQLLPARRLAGWLALGQREFYARAFTPLVTLWYMIFQRLSDNHHLSHVVADALAGGADRLSPRTKPLSRQLRSQATTSFSDARQRLPLDLCRKTLRHTATATLAALQIPKWFGLKVALMDGSTCRLRPFDDIPQHFPPHRPGNCNKAPYWCLARVVGILCLATGVVVDCALGAPRTSEQVLGIGLLCERSWQGWLLLADRNFGVYSVVRATVAAHAQGLFRLTQARAGKLARGAGLKLTPGLDEPLSWSPSKFDHCPAGLTPTPVPGRLIVARLQRRGWRPVTLYLFTTLLDPLKYPTETIVELYGQRWQIELCFRYIKSQMELGFLECRSAQMAHKEWLAGLIAYNLIRWTMAASAALTHVPLQTLSFSRARELLLGWLLRTSSGRRSVCAWSRLLTCISKARLPKRRKPRPQEPRAIRTLRKDFPQLAGSRAQARKKLAKARANS